MVKLSGPLGMFELSRFLTRRYPRIMMYHRFSHTPREDRVCADTFEKQMRVLSKRFNVMDLRDVVTALRQGHDLPSHTVVITVDDGYRDFYDVAFPILKQYRLPATLYATTGFINGDLWLWPDKIHYILNQCHDEKLELSMGGNEVIVSLASPSLKKQTWGILVDYCISVFKQEREDFVKYLAKKTRVNIDAIPSEDYQAVNWEQVKEMANHGINIGAHTCSHPILSKLESKDVTYEVVESKNKLEDVLGHTVSCFCYPNGEARDFNDHVKQTVIDAGFSNSVAAFFDKETWNDLYEIRRHGVGEDEFQFNKVVYGVEYLGSKI